MSSKHHYLIAIGVGIVAGFVLANAPSGTGIYSSFAGQTASNIYTFGAGLSSGGGSSASS